MPKRADYRLIGEWKGQLWKIYTPDTAPDKSWTIIEPDSKAWFAWLSAIPSSFSFGCFYGNSRYLRFTARKETHGQRTYWYAYLKQKGKLKKEYLGKTEKLTSKLLRDTAIRLWLRMKYHPRKN